MAGGTYNYILSSRHLAVPNGTKGAQITLAGIVEAGMDRQKNLNLDSAERRIVYRDRNRKLDPDG